MWATIPWNKLIGQGRGKGSSNLFSLLRRDFGKYGRREREYLNRRFAFLKSLPGETVGAI